MKNISDYSIAALKEVCEGVGKSFAAIKKISTKELPTGCFSREGRCRTDPIWVKLTGSKYST